MSAGTQHILERDFTSVLHSPEKLPALRTILLQLCLLLGSIIMYNFQGS